MLFPNCDHGSCYKKSTTYDEGMKAFCMEKAKDKEIDGGDRFCSFRVLHRMK